MYTSHALAEQLLRGILVACYLCLPLNDACSWLVLVYWIHQPTKSELPNCSPPKIVLCDNNSWDSTGRIWKLVCLYPVVMRPQHREKNGINWLQEKHKHKPLHLYDDRAFLTLSVTRGIFNELMTKLREENSSTTTPSRRAEAQYSLYLIPVLPNTVDIL